MIFAMRKFILAFALLVVAALIGVIFYVRVFTRAAPQFTATLESVVPARIDGWTVEDVPLAETEGMRQYVGKMLKFDQYVSRTYRKGDLNIVFYAAYWEPNGKTPFDAGGHNPDSCWVNFGWTREAREYSNAGRTVGERELVPFEYGVYSKDGERQPVIFWHLVNGRPFIYETQKLGWREGLEGAIERASVRMEDFRRLGLNQRREQMFIRISFPNQDFEKVRENPDFQAFLLSLGRLGIFTDEPWS